MSGIKGRMPTVSRAVRSSRARAAVDPGLEAQDANGAWTSGAGNRELWRALGGGVIGNREPWRALGGGVRAAH